MKIPFKADASAALEKTRRKLADVEANIAALQTSRTEKLATTEDIAEVQSIDRAISAERTAAEIYRDKIRIFEEEVRRERYVDRERQRKASIAGIEKKLAAREAIAEKIDATIDQLGSLYFELLGSPSLEPDWPFGRGPHPGWGRVDADAIRRETSWRLFGAGRARGGETVLPGPSNIGLGVTGIEPLSVAGAVRLQAKAVLGALEIMPLDHDDDREIAA